MEEVCNLLTDNGGNSWTKHTLTWSYRSTF